MSAKRRTSPRSGTPSFSVISFWKDSQRSASALREAMKAAERAKAAYDDALMRYEVQSASYVELLTARAALSDAELAEISARGECLKALAGLYAGMGELHPDLSDEVGHTEAAAERK